MSDFNNTEEGSEYDYSDMPALIPCSPELYVLELEVARTKCFACISGMVDMADRLIRMEGNEAEALKHLTKFELINKTLVLEIESLSFSLSFLL